MGNFETREEIASEYFESLLRKISNFPVFIKDPDDPDYAGKRALELGLEKFRKKFKNPFFDRRTVSLEKMAKKFLDLGMSPNIEGAREVVSKIKYVQAKNPLHDRPSLFGGFFRLNSYEGVEIMSLDNKGKKYKVRFF